MTAPVIVPPEIVAVDVNVPEIVAPWITGEAVNVLTPAPTPDIFAKVVPGLDTHPDVQVTLLVGVVQLLQLGV